MSEGISLEFDMDSGCPLDEYCWPYKLVFYAYGERLEIIFKDGYGTLVEKHDYSDRKNDYSDEEMPELEKGK